MHRTVDRPRLLILTTTFPRWSNDHEPPFVYELAKRLTSRFEVTVLAPHAPNALAHEQMEGIDVQRFRYAPERFERLAYSGGIASNLSRAKWKYLLLQGFLFSFFWAALTMVRSQRIDVVHAHWMIPSGLIGAALKILHPKVRVVVTAHGSDVFRLKNSVFVRLRRWLAKEVDAITVVGSGLASRARQEGWHSEKVSIAPMGVDLKDTFVPRPVTHQHPTIVFAGRLVENKGVEELLEALPLVKRNVPNVRLLIAGHGPLGESLQERVTEMRLSDSVEFLGRYLLDTLPAIFNRSDIAVLPFSASATSDDEGFGLTMVEAMGCGLPVVAGDVPAATDLVTHGRTGMIVDSRSREKLAAMISRLLTDLEFARGLGDAARLHVMERFDWSRAASQYASILSDPISHDQRPTPLQSL